MSNLAKVLQQLRQERDQGQKRIEQLDEALKAFDWTRWSWEDYWQARPRPKACRRTNHVSHSPQEDRCGATRPVGEVESCSAGQVIEIKLRFPHFSTFQFTEIVFLR